MTWPASPLLRVPGKLFLLGEYAVLAGGPALLTVTKDRALRLEKSSTPRREGYSLLGPSFPNPRALPELILQTLDLPLEELDSFQIDLREFYSPEGEKLGLGSSAASTVAFVKALCPDEPAAEQAKRALEIHRAFQDGHGSGADIYACAHNSPIAYQIDTPDPGFRDFDFQPLGSAPPSTPITLPRDLQFYGIWTGAPASTTSFMGALRERIRADKEATLELQGLFHRIAAISSAGIEAAQVQSSEAFLDALFQGDKAMEALGDFADLPILTERHRFLREKAKAAGFVLKPSGAGGGDFSILAGPIDKPLPAFVEDHLLVSLRH